MADNKLEIVLALSLRQFQDGVKQAIGAVNEMGGKVGKAMAGVDTGFKRASSASKAYHDTLNQLNGTADHFKNTMMQVAAAVGGAALFGNAARQAVGFNSTVEQSRIGVAALVRTFTEADMGQSFGVAEDIQRRLQIAGLQTTATYEELLRALQEGIGPALRENFDPKQVVQFTQSMTQAAAALALPMDQLGQEIRAILDGTIDRNARVANALRITNEDVKEWKATGTLFENLQRRLTAFAAAGEQSANTFKGAWSNVQDAVGMALGKASEQSFSRTTSFFLRLKDAIVTVDEAAGTFTFNEKIMAAFAGVDKAISKTLDAFSTERISAGLANLVGTLGAVAEAVITFFSSLLKVGEVIGPLGPTIASLVTWMTLLGGAFKALIGLPMLVFRQLTAMNAAFASMAGGSLLLYIKHVQEASRHTGLLRTAFASLPNAITTVSAAAGALFVGWQIGTWLNQFDIVKKAGVTTAHALTMGWLKVRQAWEWMTGGDTSAIEREMEVARKTYSDMIDEIDGKAKESGAARVEEEKKVTAAVQVSAGKQKQLTREALDEMKKQYKEYADEIKRLQGELADHQRSAEEELRDMARSGMSDLAAWQDRKREAGEFAQKARDAAEAAKKLFASGNVEAGRETYKVAAEYADKATSAYKDLNEEVKRGDQVVISQKTALQTAMAGVQEAANIKSQIIQQQTAALQDAQATLNEQSGGKLDATLDTTKGKVEQLATAAETAKGKVQEIFDVQPPEDGDWGKVWEAMESGSDRAGKQVTSTWDGVWDQFLASGSEDISSLEEKLQELTKDRHITVYIEEKVKKAIGGLVQRFASGGHLPGYGGGDRISALLEAGEFVIRKEAVSKFGAGLFHALNSLRLPDMPRFAAGGLAGATSWAGDAMTINFAFGGGPPVASMRGTKEQAILLEREFARRAMRSSR